MTTEQFNKFTGLYTKNAWADPTALFKARARILALDTSPLRDEALTAIDCAVADTAETMERAARRQREAADILIDRYRTGVHDLTETWAALRSLIEPDWDTQGQDLEDLVECTR